jgi:hypothetical protein
MEKVTGQIIPALLMLLTLATAARASTEISPGVVYQPGTQLTVSSYGIDLTVPRDWRAMLPQGAEALIMEPIGQVARMIVMAVPNSDAQNIRQLMSQPQPLDMMTQLVPRTPPVDQGGLFSQQYEVQGNNPQNLVASAYGRLGSNRTAVFVIMLEPRNQNMLPALGRQFISSISFSAPQSAAAAGGGNIDWNQRLRGRTLTYRSTSNGMSITKLMNLCSDGRFSYTDSDSHNSSSATGDFSGYSQSGYTGRWQISGNQIHLSWDDGSRSQFTLSYRHVPEYDEWGIFVDDQRWFNNQNRVCN